jgi:anti-anti-sigma factor
MTLADPDATSGATPRAKSVELKGDIDVATAGTVGEWLCELVTGDYDAVIVVCTKVTFVESRGLAMMARVQRVADEAGCQLAWRELPLPVLRAIHLTGLDAYLNIEA